ncbi:MAG: carboxypeptidase regulatory-like domain-containing protein [Acidobacteria bacterium]|nr:carboxypeptidase regulatory-like domain-containing protein [Acidobacteriota bacterium]MBI3427766.1 carboxypeptidase regulatory-like domain-containing protein [Acidobacteriota bacterium]
MQLPFASMLRLGFVLALLCFSPALLAQTNPATGTISGRVTLGGKPAQGVTVLALPANNSGQRASAQAKTDAVGQYRLTGLPAGSFKIYAAAREYVSTGEDGRSVMLNAGEQLEGQDLTLERGGVITGRVTDAAGRPLIEEYIKLFRLNASGVKTPYNQLYANTFKTDDRGIYRVYGLAAGRYLVAVGQDEGAGAVRYNYGKGRAYKLTYHHDMAATADEAQPKAIEVGYGSETSEVDIKLGASLRGHAITVRVIEAETRRPLPDLHVGYGSIRPQPFGDISRVNSDAVVTDSQGEKRFEGVLPGRYAAFIHNWNDGKDSEYYAEPQPFEVSEGVATRLEIVARRGLQVSGKVMVEGVTDAALLARAKRLQLYLTRQGKVALRSPYGNSGTLASDFSFRVSGIEPGSYSLSIGNSYESRGFEFVRVEHNGAVLGRVFEVNVPLSGVRVVLTYGSARILGQIQLTGAVLPANARVSVAAYPSGSPNSTRWSTDADAQGRFALEYLTADTYELRVSVYVPITQIVPNSPPPVSTVRLIASTKQTITVGNTGDTPVTLTLDLSAQGRRQ